MNKIIKITILILTLLAGYSVHAQQNSFINDSLESYLAREMQRWQIPGVAVCIVKDGKVVVSKGYGIRNLNSNEKVDENSLFMIASN